MARLNGGQLTPEDYKALLFNLRQQVIDGSRWISRAASNITGDYFPIRSAFISHSSDEHRDYEMLEQNYVSVGGSIEDATGDKDRPVYDLAQAAERIAASAETARSLGFVLTARAENFLRGRPDLDDTIRRLQAYEKAGADVLMAPGLPDLAAVRAVCAAVSKPVNFMVGIKGKSFTVAELGAAGVRRISLATSLYRAAMSGLVEAAREAKDKGTFGYLDTSMATPDLNAFMQK